MKKMTTRLRISLIIFLILWVYQPLHAEKDTVVNVSDAGLGSLRAAIDSCNNRPLLDTIVFAIPFPPFTINLASSLPAITDAVFINGYSQPGSLAGLFGSRIIAIGINANALLNGDIFTVNSNDVTIAGLAIYKGPNNGSGIRGGVGISNLFIWGNFIGTDNTGFSTTLGNGSNGVVVNETGGVAATGIIIGTNGDGIGDVNEGNLISCNGLDGIFLWRAQNCRISGNIIGLSQGATGPGFGNLRNGVLLTVSASNNLIGTNGDGVSDDREQNFISGNAQRGILLAAVADNNVIAGNVVGLDITTAAVGNGLNGIQIFNGSGNRVGTNGDGLSDILETNVVSSNTGSGIVITADDFFGFNSNSSDNVVAGNYVGTEPAGNAARGNSANGIYIVTGNNQSANNNVIGSNNDGVADAFERNIITNNNKGFVIAPVSGTSTATGNKTSRDSIYNNTLLGIDLNDDGITANDNGDPDTGPNELFNVPFIQSSKLSLGNLVVTGISPAGAVVEFYIADAGGEGQTFLFRAQEGNTLNGIADDSTGTGPYSDVSFGTGTDNRFGFTIPQAALPVAVNSGTILTSFAIKAAVGDSSSSEFGPVIISSLPVHFVSFAGRFQNGSIVLDWVTDNEINNDHFDVERSGNGANYSKIGTVVATSTSAGQYSFRDEHPLTGVNYYRLRQVDRNGLAAYSNTISISTGLTTLPLTVSPNPFINRLNILFSATTAELVRVNMYDQSGRLVKQYSVRSLAGINTFAATDLAGLPAGTYVVEGKGDHLTFRKQVVKK